METLRDDGVSVGTGHTVVSLVGACSAERFMFSPDVSLSRQQKANEINLLEANAVVVGFCSALSAVLFVSCIPTRPPGTCLESQLL